MTRSTDDPNLSTENTSTEKTSTDLGWFHEHALGRGVLGMVVGLLAICILGWNIPGSGEVRADVRATLRPVVYALAIDQGWAVFAPNPSRTSMAVEGEVTFSDGSQAVYQFPDGEPMVGALREFRWRKLERRFRTDDRNRSLWKPTAEWVAVQMASDDRPVVEVALVRYLAQTPKLGSGEPHAYERDVFHTESFDPPVTGAPAEEDPSS